MYINIYFWDCTGYCGPLDKLTPDWSGNEACLVRSAVGAEGQGKTGEGRGGEEMDEEGWMMSR